MADKKQVLATDVHVTNKDGESKLLRAGSELPSWATKLVTNKKALVQVEEAPAGDSGTGGQVGTDPGSQTPPETPYVAKREGVEDVQPYDAWAYHDLQAESIGRKLEGGGAGKADEIVARLKADDAAQAQQ
jgi:hypothetical protein